MSNQQDEPMLALPAPSAELTKVWQSVNALPGAALYVVTNIWVAKDIPMIVNLMFVETGPGMPELILLTRSASPYRWQTAPGLWIELSSDEDDHSWQAKLIYVQSGEDRLIIKMSAKHEHQVDAIAEIWLRSANPNTSQAGKSYHMTLALLQALAARDSISIIDPRQPTSLLGQEHRDAETF